MSEQRTRRNRALRGVAFLLAVAALGTTWLRANRNDALADMREGRGGSAHDVREYLYRVANGYTNGTRKAEGDGYLQPDLITPRPDAKRYLLMGDSYTFGWGLANIDARWSTQLALALGEHHDIDAYALPGASLYTYANWARAAVARGEAYDTVIIGFSENDAHPGPLEAADRRTSYTLYDDLPETRRGAIERGDEANPNQEALEAALDDLETVGRRRVLIPLYGADQSYWPSIERSIETARSRGWEIAPMRITKTTIQGRNPGTLTVAPFDTHPNERLQAAYAADAATMFEPHGRGEGALIGHVSPPASSMETNGGRGEIRYDGEGRTCVPVSHPRGRYHCDDTPYAEIGGRRYGIQWGECQTFGGGAVLISLPRGAATVQIIEHSGGEVRVWAAGWGQTWRELEVRGQQANLTPDDHQIALSAGGGCGDGEIVPPDLRIVIE